MLRQNDTNLITNTFSISLRCSKMPKSADRLSKKFDPMAAPKSLSNPRSE